MPKSPRYLHETTTDVFEDGSIVEITLILGPWRLPKSFRDNVDRDGGAIASRVMKMNPLKSMANEGPILSGNKLKYSDIRFV